MIAQYFPIRITFAFQTLILTLLTKQYANEHYLLI